MNVILLSGGSGKRLWPLSNDIRSKQFIKIFKNNNGEYESMLQRVYRQINEVDSNSNITIATSKTQISLIHNQLGNDVGISIEPSRRDTFPAILLATLYLRDIKNINENEYVIVLPVDPYVKKDYFECIKKLDSQVRKDEANIVLMGIKPTYPSEKYGYIIPKTNDDISFVSCFKEKPDTKTAIQYINQNALWNGGVFAFKIKYLINKAHELLDFIDYNDLYINYDNLRKISFDYEILEKEKSIQVLRFNGDWKDRGTWNTLTETIDDSIIGKGIMNETCTNTHILNELDRPILAMGLHDVVISASSEGILIADKNESCYIRPYVEKFEQQVMFAEKSWGSYQVLDVEKESLTIKVTLNKGNKMNYHNHMHRNEVWVVIEGNGRTIVDGMEQNVQPGDVIAINVGCKHTIIADTKLKVIEVQLGKEITTNDKQKFTHE